ncbi:MAG: flagellar FlbD family protein [Paenibacillaceae bacterium]|jgi:flagellar protein FlbD|nr:flagellar FlbD family protein [Paenibacillaceae bacterium]
MITVTRLNGTRVTINAWLIETIEETPDTVITLTTGKKFVVREQTDQIAALVRALNVPSHTVVSRMNIHSDAT